ncbi:hypothetical protein, partial [Klebsiella pneumoniae]|uniref:hypothetical protein n=1 Tax=Klebsiella pneumoniae TaxID=573 RepID=UPI0025A1D7F5
PMSKSCRGWVRLNGRQAFFLVGLLVPLAIGGLSAIYPEPVHAQTLPGGSADLLNQLRQQYGQQSSGSSQDFSGSGQGNVIVQ